MFAHPLALLFDLEKEFELAAYWKQSNIQSIFSLRAKRRALLLSNALLTPKGKLQNVEEILSLLQSSGHIPTEKGYNDGEILSHFVRVLKSLTKESALVQRLYRMGMPLFDKKLEKLLSATLAVEEPLTDRHVIWGALSALLCPLRQSIGSCFASAPAILVHEEYMGQFLEDLHTLFIGGNLRRVFGGKEFNVPMSPSCGLGDLKKDLSRTHLKETVAFSPSLLEALRVLNFIESHLPFEEKVKRAAVLISPYLERSDEVNLYDVFSELLLRRMDLSKEELQSGPSPLTLNGEKVEKFYALLEKASHAFVGQADHLLLKVWEFTIASLADVKLEFSKWNLFSSLGLHPEEKGGIGELIYTILEKKLEETNHQLENYHQEYIVAFEAVRATEILLRSASSEREIKRLKAEHQSRLYHLQITQEIRDKCAEKTHYLSEFFSFLIKAYMEKLEEHFQEVYDPEMHGVKTDEYDDSPAGFRLAYKQGRSYVHSWVFIHTSKQYIRYLQEFFSLIENEMISLCPSEEGKEEIPPLTTAIIHHLEREEFLVSAFYRMAKAHRVPLQKETIEDLEKFEKKPWAYTSGASISTLVKTYFKREGSLSEEARWVDSPTDLCVFILDTLKMLPPRVESLFVQNPRKRLLMTSPTHVFSLLPNFLGEGLLFKGWQDSGFSYTWVRDQIVLPRQAFYKSLQILPKQQIFLLQKLSTRLPLMKGHHLERGFIPSSQAISVAEFKKKILLDLKEPFSSFLEGFLFEMLPVMGFEEVEILFKQLKLKKPPSYQSFFGRIEVHEALVYSLSKEINKSCLPIDLHLEVLQIMEENKLSPPRMVIFADSNWAKYFFGFMVKPSEGTLELWRSDALGLSGAPMSEWSCFLNGENKHSWSIFLHPYEYSCSSG